MCRDSPIFCMMIYKKGIIIFIGDLQIGSAAVRPSGGHVEIEDEAFTGVDVALVRAPHDSSRGVSVAK